jgi:hypothetical protein
MTDQTDTQTHARLAEQIAWQRQAAMLLAKLLELAAKKKYLPAIDWKMAHAGATLHGDCSTGYPSALRREYFTAWRDAITAATGAEPDTDREHTMAGEETWLAGRWERLPIDLNPLWRDLRPGSRAPSVRVVLTASIWPAEEDEG